MRYVTFAALLLAGCGQSDANVYGSPMGQRVVGNELSVQVTNVWNQADAFPPADAHCHKFGRAARFVAMHGTTASFDCLKVT